MITGQTTSNTYQGDGSNRVWNISFEFTDSSQIKFKVNGEAVTTNYELNTVAKTLTYPTVESELDPLTSADEIEIYRDTEITQDIDFVNGGPLNADMIEKGLDKLTMISQELLRVARESSGLVAGKGIKISDGVVSLKGATIMPDGTDVDTLKEEGVYIIKDPTSTSGMPKQPNYGTSINGSYAIVKVFDTNIKRTGATYFVYQEMVLFLSSTGVDSLSEPHIYIRNLTDFTYTTQSWNILGNDLITIQKNGADASLSYFSDRGTQIIMNPSGYGSAIPSTGITSLALINYATSYLGKARIVFKAGSGFSLTVTGNDYWIGTKPTTWTEGSIYMITMEAGFMKCEELAMS